MSPFGASLRVPTDSAAPNARAFVRSFNVLLKFARLYGLKHTRSASQFETTWVELQQCLLSYRETGLLLGASGSQLLLDGEPLESTAAERSFADLLTTAGVASIGFTPKVQREEFANLVRTFMEIGPKAGTLAERLEKNFGANKESGIRVNEIRFVAEDAAFSDAKLAAQLTAKTLGSDATQLQDWFRSPEKMIQLIAAAEGSHGGSVSGTAIGSGPGFGRSSVPGLGGGSSPSSGAPSGSASGTAGTHSGVGVGGETTVQGAAGGSGLGARPGSAPAVGAGGGDSSSHIGSGAAGEAVLGSAAPTAAGGGKGLASGNVTGADRGTGGSAVSGASGVGGTGQTSLGRGAAAVEFVPLQEAEIYSLLRLLAQFGEAAQSQSSNQLDQQSWQQKFAALPPNAQASLRQALATIAAKTPSAKVDETMLLRLAEDLAIRFALDRFQRGEVRVNAVRQMLDRMGNELETLRKLLRAREERIAKAGLPVESHADVLDLQFWAAVPESGKRAVLTSPDAWCIPPRNVQSYVEELLARGDSEAAGNILLKYASCVRNKDPEARKKAAIGLGQLAGLYSKAASQRLQDALMQIGKQMAAERDPELQTLLSAAFVRLSQESATRRYYPAMQQALDSLADLEEHRPTWVQSLRPRTGIENRLSDFIEEALAAEALPEGFMGVLTRLPEASAENLAVRLARSGRRSERESIVQMAEAIGGPCKRHLTEILKSAPSAKAATVVGLLSRLDPAAVEGNLPERLREGRRGFHDAVVRQLSTAGAPARGRILGDSLEAFDSAVVSLALDEIGMCGDPDLAPKLLQLAEGKLLPQGSDYLRVKAIEALGRIRAPVAVEHLRKFVESRKTFGWVYPEEIRIAAAQALIKIDPEWMKGFIPQSGLDPAVLSLAPLDPIPERDVVRHRRYRRVRLPRSVPTVITSARGKYSSGISVLSLEGGLLSGDIQLAVGTEATLRIPAGIRSISMQAIVRFVRSHQAGFEMVGMGLEDRAKLRRLLVSLGGPRTALRADNPEPRDPASSD
jgi:PilZ domain